MRLLHADLLPVCDIQPRQTERMQGPSLQIIHAAKGIDGRGGATSDWTQTIGCIKFENRYSPSLIVQILSKSHFSVPV